MVAQASNGTLGVDLEEYLPERTSIAKRVLTDAEQVSLRTLPAEQQWIGVLLRFSIKESVYKALDPYVARYVGFEEAEVVPNLQGSANVELRLKNHEGPFRVDARYCWLASRLLTSVRIQPG